MTHVVVTCSNRKRLPVPPALSARSLSGTSIEHRAAEWIERLGTADGPRMSATDLYAGEHWAVVRSIRDAALAARRPISMWVLSAGYGLISCDAAIHPYAATFSGGHADSVASNGSRHDWWRALSKWPGPDPGAPRSLTRLAQRDPDAAIIVAVSPPYLDACSADLLEAAGALSTRQQLSVICMGANRSTEVAEYVLPGDARLQHAFGGTRQALNARVLAHLIVEEAGTLNRDAAAKSLERLLASQPALVRYDRLRCSDAEVTSYIKQRLTANPLVSRNRLLREFRDQGKACEQTRFATLFVTARQQP